jgi:multidrug resistance efflux pump
MSESLRALRRNAAGPLPGAGKKRNFRGLRGWLFRAGPLLMGAASLALLLLLFGRRMLPAEPVELETVVSLPASPETTPGGIRVGGDPFDGEVLFQSSGWFEASPYPHRATALAGGVVEAVHVLEGQQVEAGEVLVTLVRDDARLRLEAAEAALEAASALVAAARSERALSVAREERVHQEIAVAEARRRELADLAERTAELGPEVIPEQEIIQAGLRLETQDARIAALEARLLEQQTESERLDGQLRQRESDLAAAEVRLAEARLELDRMVVRSPVAGIVQRLMAAPGEKKLLAADNPDSATMAILFHPERMQARIDVPLAEASRLRIGQPVLLESEFLPGTTLRGRVARILGEADLQRNTLQAKVEIEEPVPGIRPEVLCRARFLAGSLDGGDGTDESGRIAGSAAGLQVLVPSRALMDRDGRTASVWVVDESGRRAERRNLRLGKVVRDGYVAATDGVRPGDRVVLDPAPGLREGERIRHATHNP